MRWNNKFIAILVYRFIWCVSVCVWKRWYKNIKESSIHFTKKIFIVLNPPICKDFPIQILSHRYAENVIPRLSESAFLRKSSKHENTCFKIAETLRASASSYAFSQKIDAVLFVRRKLTKSRICPGISNATNIVVDFFEPDEFSSS